ncbi:sulfatase [Catenovulum sp. 2E275]|uniref:sulfatase n=1 Tax=Catenovulum sp. 2E275 TaxID=2980497 RepID=UPI0021D3E784|nr:sulfatase [Catenovulum sp. 2E275]MCU4676260.1 sulfatase [Catenovulum sp. 2E275]
MKSGHSGKKSIVINLGLLILALVAFPSALMAKAVGKQPNILFILADDAGYHDFGFHGSQTMNTPNLDQLAKQGILFTNAYVSAAVCGPSRAGILTGKYQQKFGYEENNVPGYMSASGITGDDMGLPLEQKILPQYLKELGYTTALIGKWHQGNADRFHPTKRGFDYFYGFRGGARSYFPFGENNPNYRPEDYLEEGFGNFKESPRYLTDALVDKTIAFIQQSHSNKTQTAKPFFAFLSLTAVHAPMEAEEADLAQYPNLQGKRKTLAAMTLSMDRAIGRLLNKLDQLNLADNTLVVFTNDNGGPTDHTAANNAPLSGTKANHLEGGIRVPFIMRWPTKLPKQQVYSQPVITLDLLPTFYQAAGGHSQQLADIDGVNLLPYLTNNRKTKLSERPHQALYWKKENRAAIRDGDWKLLRYPDRPAELYNLVEDQSEKVNLAQHYPEKVVDLYKKLFAWELTLERPLWQLKRQYEGDAMQRMDKFRTHIAD